MARQGRQPRQQAGSSQPSSSKPKKQTASSKSSTKKTKAGSSSAPMDLYSYSSSIKRARGDVDPEARASFQADARAGKGKGRQQQSDDDMSEDEFDADGDGIVEFTGVKPKGLKMGMDTDEEGGFDDDEDIDSDDAIEDEDDLPAKPTKLSKKEAVKQAKKPIEVDLDEDEIDWDDEDGEGYMDLTELLDNGEFADDDDDEDEQAGGAGSDDSGENDEDDESEEESEDVDDDDDESVDSEYEGALDKLSSFVDGLETKKRKQTADDDDDATESPFGQKKKRVVLKERTEAYDEGDFVAVTGQDDSKVQLDDLLASFADSTNPRLAALRKSLKPLAAAKASSSSSSNPTNSHLKSTGPIAAPLPARLQDKLDREAAYEKTKEEADKWNETVRRMKGHSGLGVEGARHERLQLPLMTGAGDAARDANAAEWAAKFKPTNDMESSIQALLVAGQMSSKDLQKAEQAALATLDPAEVAARQAALRQQRDLMFRAERKAKRVAKIKSKAFRKIHRKGKGKGEEMLSLEELAELDKLDGGDRVSEEQARMETVRARERATLKHSAKNGRWSKQTGDLTGLDEERNAAIRDMVKRGETLRRKIDGTDGQDSNDEFASSGDSDDNRSDDDDDLDTIRQRAFDELASLDAKEAAAELNGPKLKGVLNMKFMQDALKREKAQVQASADELRRRLDSMDQAAEVMDGDADENLGLSEQVQGNLGRMVFGPAAGVQKALTPATAAEQAAPKAKLTTKLSGPLAVAAAASTRPPRAGLSNGAAAEAESNPWLNVDAEAASNANKVSRKMNKANVGKDSRDASRSAAKADRALSRQHDARAAEEDDAHVEIDPSTVLTKAPKQPQLQDVTAPSRASARATHRETVDSSDEDNEEDHAAQRGKGPAAFKQRELVAKAFAGDNVVADFEAEKRRQVEQDGPTERDDTLPGWGSWSGKGVKKQKNARKFITKIAGIAPEKRKDAQFNNVIISEKKDKKAQKYLLKDLPFPYTSAAQMEHKLRTPLGAEWSTATILRDQTMPSVLLKPGVTIRPVDKKV